MSPSPCDCDFNVKFATNIMHNNMVYFNGRTICFDSIKEVFGVSKVINYTTKRNLQVFIL